MGGPETMFGPMPHASPTCGEAVRVPMIGEERGNTETGATPVKEGLGTRVVIVRWGSPVHVRLHQRR